MMMNAGFFAIFTKASDFGWCVCTYGNLFTKYILTKASDFYTVYVEMINFIEVQS
jgi:hypothetical protein